MRIITDNKGDKYIDQDLFTYINKIWLNYNVEIDNDSNILFAKNTTINRLVTDYCGKNINRVIKKEKADYIVINKFELNNFPQFFDGVNISDDDTKEVVYSIYNQSSEVQDTVELILDFYDRKQEVKFTNQDKLNDSLNNGFIIDKDNYISIKELVDSKFSENHMLAVNMIVNSDLKSNVDWILYLFHEKHAMFRDYDKKHIVTNYINSLNTGVGTSLLFSQLDQAFKVVKNEDVINRFVNLVRSRFQSNINTYFSKQLGTNKFVLEDFKIRLNNG